MTLRTDARYHGAGSAALDYATRERPASHFREGVLWAESVKTDTFFVIVNKSEPDYSPTMCQDNAISPSPFHW